MPKLKRQHLPASGGVSYLGRRRSAIPTSRPRNPPKDATSWHSGTKVLPLVREALREACEFLRASWSDPDKPPSRAQTTRGSKLSSKVATQSCFKHIPKAHRLRQWMGASLRQLDCVRSGGEPTEERPGESRRYPSADSETPTADCYHNRTRPFIEGSSFDPQACQKQVLTNL